MGVLEEMQREIEENRRRIVELERRQGEPAADDEEPVVVGPQYILFDSLSTPRDRIGQGGDYRVQGRKSGKHVETFEGMDFRYSWVRYDAGDDGPRHELGILGDSGLRYEPLGVPLVYQWSVMHPSEGNSPPGDYSRFVCGQFHGADSARRANPNLSWDYYLKHGDPGRTLRCQIWARADGVDHRVLWGEPGNTEFDRWYTWTVAANWTVTPQGFLEVWRNDERLFRWDGPTAYRDVVGSRMLGPYFHFGVYYPGGRPPKEKRDDPSWRPPFFPVARRVIYRDLGIAEQSELEKMVLP